MEVLLQKQLEVAGYHQEWATRHIPCGASNKQIKQPLLPETLFQTDHSLDRIYLLAFMFWSHSQDFLHNDFLFLFRLVDTSLSHSPNSAHTGSYQACWVKPWLSSHPEVFQVRRVSEPTRWWYHQCQMHLLWPVRKPPRLFTQTTTMCLHVCSPVQRKCPS